MVCNNPADWLTLPSLTYTLDITHTCCNAKGFCVLFSVFFFLYKMIIISNYDMSGSHLFLLTVLQNAETMQLLLKSAAACEGGSVSMLLGTVGGEVTEKLCLGETLTDALHQLLLTLNSKATSPHLILAPLVAFITPGKSVIIPLQELLTLMIL